MLFRSPGDILYEFCPLCGVPLEVARRIYDLNKGTYTDPDTGLRMALFGPKALDSILEDLETELGEAVPRAVIEAQRRYIRSTRSLEQWIRDASTLRSMMSLRGLGYLKEFGGDRTHLTLKIENSCLHLMMLGTIQALVELAYRAESSTCEWDLLKDGDLIVTVMLR